MQAVEAQATGDTGDSAESVHTGKGPSFCGRLGPSRYGEHGQEEDEDVGQDIPCGRGQCKSADVDTLRIVAHDPKGLDGQTG